MTAQVVNLKTPPSLPEANSMQPLKVTSKSVTSKNTTSKGVTSKNVKCNNPTKTLCFTVSIQRTCGNYVEAFHLIGSLQPKLLEASFAPVGHLLDKKMSAGMNLKRGVLQKTCEWNYQQNKGMQNMCILVVAAYCLYIYILVGWKRILWKSGRGLLTVSWGGVGGWKSLCFCNTEVWPVVVVLGTHHWFYFKTTVFPLWQLSAHFFGLFFDNIFPALENTRSQSVDEVGVHQNAPSPTRHTLRSLDTNRHMANSKCTLAKNVTSEP